MKQIDNRTGDMMSQIEDVQDRLAHLMDTVGDQDRSTQNLLLFEFDDDDGVDVDAARLIHEVIEKGRGGKATRAERDAAIAKLKPAARMKTIDDHAEA